MSVPMKPGDPAYWMLFDDFTTTPVVYKEDCYICRDKEFAQMGLPLCRPCPECQRQGRGSGHIPADDSACNVCGYEDGPDDYPQPAPVPPFKAVVHADVAIPEQEMRPGEDTVITVSEDCTVYGVQIWDSADPAKPIHWIAVSKTLRLGDSLHVPGTISVTEG